VRRPATSAAYPTNRSRPAMVLAATHRGMRDEDISSLTLAEARDVHHGARATLISVAVGFN